MRDIPHQGQGGGQAEGLEDIPDGLGEPQWMGAVRNEHSPHEGEGSPGNAQWAAGGAEMGNKPGGEGISNSWTQHHCHIQPPVALQEPATPGLPLRLALGGAGLPLRLALGGGGKALNGQQRGLVSRERWEVELDFGGRSRST